MTDLVAYALAALIALAPPARRGAPPGWAETEDAYRARLTSIADDIGSVSSTRMHVAALVGIAVHESAVQPDVDAGRCYRAGAWAARCDGGRAQSIWQLQDASAERRLLYRTNRREAAKEALRRILSSLGQCRAHEPAVRLAAFASGTCGRGQETARGLDVFVRRALAIRP